MAVTSSTVIMEKLQNAADRARKVREEVSKRAALEAAGDSDAIRSVGDVVRTSPPSGIPPQR